jgi:glycopeptide antibiotics resistance protein
MQVKGRQLPWLALAVGFSTELTQLATCLILGVNYRSVDINDTLLNALGVLIGYGIFRGLAIFYFALGRKYTLHNREMFSIFMQSSNVRRE